MKAETICCHNIPAIETLLDPAMAAKVWGEAIANNAVFQKQTEERRKLLECFTTITDSLPCFDMNLITAIEQELITKNQVAEFFDRLSQMLESSCDYRRIILYLPFEFLPNKNWQVKTSELQDAISRFKTVYLESWNYLLKFYDVRANFVDGDVLEKHYFSGDHPRVVKAAHLLPKIVENGMMQIKDIFQLIKESNDQILRNSLADTLPVSADMGLIAEKELTEMEQSTDKLLVSMARIIKATGKSKPESIVEEQKDFSYACVGSDLTKKFLQIEKENYGDITAKRRAWLIEKSKKQAIKTWGKTICLAIIKNEKIEYPDFLKKSCDSPSQEALVEGIRMAIEKVVKNNQTKAEEIFENYKSVLFSLWKIDDLDLKEAITKTLRHFQYLGIVKENVLANLGIIQPTLSGPFYQNLKLIQNELMEIEKMIAQVEADPELSKMIYPVVLAFGSRLKGYGEKKSDIDLGIFIKPSIEFSRRAKLKNLLQKIFTGNGIKTDEIVEFWLEEKDGKLDIHDFPDHDITLGDSSQSHVLFGGAWIGKKEARQELQKKLLTQFMEKSDKKFRGRPLHNIHLEELERDSLLYRLLHKGYERFFSKASGINTPHADEIDGQSLFYDSGYRQLATKLYLGRVFLPQI